MKSALMRPTCLLLLSLVLGLFAPSYGADTKATPPNPPAAKDPASPPKKPGEKPKDPPNLEPEYYRIIALDIPKDIILECGALALMPDGRLAVGTRRGDIYMVEGAFADPPTPKFTRWAAGLHEILGLAEREGWLYATQRPEVTRLKDSTKSGRADVYETFSDAWGIKGDYHEFNFGAPFDKNGNLWVTLTLTGSVTSGSEFRGWAMRIAPDGKATPIVSGVRSTGGLGFDADGELFMTDNQGFWNGADGLKHLSPGRFVGNPTGNKWYSLAPNMGPQPKDPATPSRMLAEAQKMPEYELPACLFPYRKMGQSASGITCDITSGKFGPFTRQLFVGDQSHSTIYRVALEKVKGVYQGACFNFRRGFASGIVPMIQAPDGSVFVGGTNRGWGSKGPRPFALERLVWTGKTPFDILTMQVKPDGFDLTFTEPVDPITAADVKSYALTTYTYIYQSSYGSPEVDPTTCTIKSAIVSDDGLHVRLAVDALVPGHVHELHLDGVRNAKAQPLLHPAAYYTLWYLPEN